MSKDEPDAAREDRLRRLAPMLGWALGRALRTHEAGGPVYGLARTGIWLIADKAPVDFTHAG